MPRNLYVVLREPSLLAGMFYPGVFTPWEKMKAAGFTGFVCLCDSWVSYDPSPLRVLYSVEMEDLHLENSPRNPEAQEELVRQAAAFVGKKSEVRIRYMCHL